MARPSLPDFMKKSKLLTFRIRNNEDAKRMRKIINKVIEKERKKKRRSYEGLGI